MKKTTPIKQILILGIALTLLLGYQYSGAQWTPPPASPPNSNVDAPINTGTSPQSKLGNIGAIELIASDYVKAGLQMWSPEYCDENGANCIDPATAVFIDAACSDGQLLYKSGGVWTCSNITSVLPNCSNGQILLRDGGMWVCAAK